MKTKSSSVLSVLFLLFAVSARAESIDALYAEQIEKCQQDPNCPVSPAPATQDAFNPASCTAPALTTAIASQYFQPAETLTVLGTARFQAQMRKCAKFTGCTGWAPISTEGLIYPDGGSKPLPPTGTMYLFAQSAGIAFRMIGDQATNFRTIVLESHAFESRATDLDWLRASSGGSEDGSHSYLRLKTPSGRYSDGFNEANAVTVQTRVGCTRIVLETKYGTPEDTTGWLEYQVGLLGRY